MNIKHIVIAAAFILASIAAATATTVNITNSSLSPSTAYADTPILAYAAGITNKTGGTVSFDYIIYVNGVANTTGSAYSQKQYDENASNYSQTVNGDTDLDPGGPIVFADNLSSNYSTQQNETFGLIYQIRHGTLATYNITVPTTCEQQTTRSFYTNIKLQSGPRTKSRPYCYNGTDYETIGTEDVLVSLGTMYSGTNFGATVNWHDGDWTIGTHNIIGTYDSGSSDEYTGSILWEEALYRTIGFANASNNNIVNLSSTYAKGTNITLSVRVNDGVNYSAYTNSSVLTIANTAPNVTSVFVSAITGGVNCTYVFADIDSDAESNSTYRWFKNGTNLSSTSRTLGSGNYTVNDLIVCEVRPSDGTNFGSYTNSSNYTVGDNETPTISGITIPSNGNDSVAVSLYANCSDNYQLANGYPKISWENQVGVRTSNFSMTSVTGNQYVKSFLFTAGAYNNFIVVCRDGSENELSTQTSDILSVAATGGGGDAGSGGGGDSTVFSGDVTACGITVLQPSDTLRGLTSVLCPIDGTKNEKIIITNPSSSTTIYRVKFINMSCESVPDVTLEGKTSQAIQLKDCTCPSTQMTKEGKNIEGKITITDVERGGCFQSIRFTARGSWIAAHPFITIGLLAGALLGIAVVFGWLTR